MLLPSVCWDVAASAAAAVGAAVAVAVSVHRRSGRCWRRLTATACSLSFVTTATTATKAAAAAAPLYPQQQV